MLSWVHNCAITHLRLSRCSCTLAWSYVAITWDVHGRELRQLPKVLIQWQFLNWNSRIRNYAIVTIFFNKGDSTFETLLESLAFANLSCRSFHLRSLLWQKLLLAFRRSTWLSLVTKDILWADLTMSASFQIRRNEHWNLFCGVLQLILHKVG